MAHNIWEANGRHNMFVVGDRKAAWHELGQRTDQAVTWEQAMQLAGLDWEVCKLPLYGFADVKSASGELRVLPGAFGIFRELDNEFLGEVGEQYTPIQNRYSFDFVDSLIDSVNGAHYHSAGALGNGERIWCMAKVPGSIKVRGVDESEVYVFFTTSHDGSMAATCKLSTIRIVCMNTLNMALSSAGAMVRVKHTRDAQRRLDQAKRLMDGVSADAKKLEEKLNLLALRKMTKESMVSILDKLFPKPADPKTNPTRRENLLAEILTCYESNDRNAIPEIRGTAYNLLNAVTEWTDHVRGARISSDRKASGYSESQARAENAMVGTGDKLKTEALEILLEGTANNPLLPARTIYSMPASTLPIAPQSTGSALLDDVLAGMN